ncbi:hypothetical protein SMCF_5881, partial [Streptomyces coelicoflavus ZG0656]
MDDDARAHPDAAAEGTASRPDEPA